MLTDRLALPALSPPPSLPLPSPPPLCTESVGWVGGPGSGPVKDMLSDADTESGNRTHTPPPNCIA